MYKKVSFLVTVLALLNFFIVAAFTVGSSRLCPNNAKVINGTKTCPNGSDWDTISEMVTRDDRVRNGFAASLVISAILIYFIVSLILDRLDFYYVEVREIGYIARSSTCCNDFVAKLSRCRGACARALLQVINDHNYEPAAIIRSCQHSTPHKSYTFWSPLAFYEDKKSCVWFVYYGAMLCYLGFGVYSTDVNTEVHTALAKGAFTLLMVLVLGLTHLGWNHMMAWHIGQIITLCSLAGSVLAGVSYSLTTVYWWEYVLVACLHACVLGMCVFRVNFAYHNVSIARYGGGDYRVDIRGPRVQYLSLRL